MFVRNERARRYILRVLADGSVRVTIPRRGSRREAGIFLGRHLAWISRERLTRLVKVGRRPTAGPGDDLEARRTAERELPARLLELAAAHGLTVGRVSIRNQRSRWGSCSSTGTITLNWRLVRMPPGVRDYVMLHELMHLREANHSKRFWRLVASVCPGHAEARAWLKQHQDQLM